MEYIITFWPENNEPLALKNKPVTAREKNLAVIMYPTIAAFPVNSQLRIENVRNSNHLDMLVKKPAKNNFLNDLNFQIS